MSEVTDAKSEWVRRVLHVETGKSGAMQSAPARPAKDVSLREIAKCRLAWVKTVSEVHQQTQTLKAVVMQELRDSEELTEQELSEASGKLAQIDGMVADIDESLADLLDDVINAEPGPKRLQAQQAALTHAAKLVQFASTNEEFDLIDENEYLTTNVKALTLDGLTAVQDALAEAA